MWKTNGDGDNGTRQNCDSIAGVDREIFLLLQWFRNGEEIYRLVPGAKRELRRLVFNTHTVKIDIESSKVRRGSSS